MRVAVVGRTYLLRANRAKWRYLPPDLALTLITPARKRHSLRAYALEPSQRWPHRVVPAWLTDRLSGFGFSPVGLWRALRQARPRLVQVDEEPSSLALLEVLLFKRLLGYRVAFFTWENQSLRYPFPFGAVRRLALRWADGAIAGNQEAAARLRQAGFQKPVAVIPQLGVDPEHFAPHSAGELRRALELNAFTVGYVGRLVPEKGLLLLLDALTGLELPWQWLIVGRGPLRPIIERQAQQRGLAGRLRWVDTVPHEDVQRYLNALDVLVLPSQSTPRWKEQFGHVLIEAMACGVPVVGSNSGAIPEVIGEAGLIFPEGQPEALARHLDRLQADSAWRATLGRRGRDRVLAHYTNQRLAEQTVVFWREVCACA